METYQVIACPSTELSHTNRAILNHNDNFAQLGHIAVRYPRKEEAFVFSVVADKSVPPGKIAFNGPGRKWASLLVNSTIEAAPYKFQPQTQCLNTITFFIDFASRQNAPVNEDFNTDQMSKFFSEMFNNQAFTVGQLIGFVYPSGNRNVTFELRVKDMEAMNIQQNE